MIEIDSGYMLSVGTEVPCADMPAGFRAAVETPPDTTKSPADMAKAVCRAISADAGPNSKVGPIDGILVTSKFNDQVSVHTNWILSDTAVERAQEVTATSKPHGGIYDFTPDNIGNTVRGTGAILVSGICIAGVISSVKHRRANR